MVYAMLVENKDDDERRKFEILLEGSTFGSALDRDLQRMHDEMAARNEQAGLTARDPKTYMPQVVTGDSDALALPDGAPETVVFKPPTSPEEAEEAVAPTMIAPKPKVVQPGEEQERPSSDEALRALAEFAPGPDDSDSASDDA